MRFIFLAVWSFFVFSAVGQSYVTDTFSFTDAARNRNIPVKSYRPFKCEGSFPVIIFSHGLGGSREAAPYLGEYLAQNGYICFFIQHEGSDESVWKNAKSFQVISKLKASIKEPRNFTNRVADIPFVIKQLVVLQESDSVFAGHLNLSKIGMAGHSYGARSTMIAAGERIGGRITTGKVPEIRAGLVLSPNLPNEVKGNLTDYYSDIDIPLFHMTGTLDDDPLQRTEGFSPLVRQQPYKNITTSTQYLLVLNEANHQTFGGGQRRNKFQNDHSIAHLNAIKAGALAFFDAYLKLDENQLNWLRNQYKGTLNSGDIFEFKQ